MGLIDLTNFVNLTNLVIKLMLCCNSNILHQRGENPVQHRKPDWRHLFSFGTMLKMWKCIDTNWKCLHRIESHMCNPAFLPYCKHQGSKSLQVWDLPLMPPFPPFPALKSHNSTLTVADFFFWQLIEIGIINSCEKADPHFKSLFRWFQQMLLSWCKSVHVRRTDRVVVHSWAV